MPSLETLRKVILLTLYDNRALLVGVDDSANRRELAGILTDAVAIHIATEATLEAFADVPAPTEDAESTSGRCRSVFAWPPGGTVTECEVLRSDGQWLRFELRDGRWERNARGWRLAARPLVWRHSLETPADGGFGARHKGRPRLTVADADTCAACHEARTSCQRLFFLSALGRPGGGKFLIENVLCLRGAHRRAALRWILETRGL